jgi:asparagine synthase (glutamine-hydrolysing)
MSLQAGIFYFDERPVPEREGAEILDATFSRDCEAPTSHRMPGVFLAHADWRLDTRIPDSTQPLIGERGAITFDGRLDNRDDLLLRLRDILAANRSDAALAGAAYDRWGVAGLAHLIGDWSVSIWDEKQKAVVLASDYAGVRPLYYCVQKNRVLWSTRLAPLAGWAQENEIDVEYVANFLLLTGCPNRTPYQGIRSVPPGHAVHISKHGTRIEAFWKLPIGNTIRYRSESDYEEHLRELFREAVRCRLRTTSPVLSELSGGLDSSSIVCMASHLLRSGDARAPRLVTLSCEHEGSRDKSFYTAVEKFCNVDSIHVSAADHPFLTEAQTGGAMPAFWEPMQSHTATLVRQTGAKTYLTGQLGDIVMGNWWDDSEQVAGLLRAGRVGPALQDALSWSQVLHIPIYPILWRALLTSLPPSLSPASASRRGVDNVNPKNKEDSLAPGCRRRAGENSLSQEWLAAPPERRKHFREVSETVQMRHLQPRAPLQHLCYTHPFAHRPLVTFMLSIPADIVCRPGEPRRLMRRSFHELWPPELRKRKSKDGFGGVFLDSLRPLAVKLLERPDQWQVAKRGYVDPASLKKRLEMLTHSLDCNEGQLRHIILLEFWLRAREKRLAPEVMPLSA